jgi:hypothetical protein
VVDGTRNLLASGAVAFTVPKSIQQTEVAGQESFWIRARLVGGDYGRETFRLDKKDVIVSEKKSLRPPKVSALRIVYVAPPVPPTACLTFNNLDYLDQTAAAQRSEAHFKPFVTLERELRTLHWLRLTFAAGPVRLLLDAAERTSTRRGARSLTELCRDRKWKARRRRR